MFFFPFQKRKTEHQTKISLPVTGYSHSNKVFPCGHFSAALAKLRHFKFSNEGWNFISNPKTSFPPPTHTHTSPYTPFKSPRALLEACYGNI